MTKFSKKLRVFIGGLHKIIAAACLFYFFYIQPNRAYFKRQHIITAPLTVIESQNSHHGASFAFFLFGKFLKHL
ncbi:hypothetical protein [Wolbachia endosymbiont (group A) of Clivina fossor]|uniref:hypothetical protein n=1 Tax=Wolbachia endosymbiont (group A) of Clivina fossor TaxID=3066133 RepID=UPI003132AF1D